MRLHIIFIRFVWFNVPNELQRLLIEEDYSCFHDKVLCAHVTKLQIY